jgi:hypothetical protein
MRIKPTTKGILTAAAMIAVILGIYYAGRDANANLQYLVYIFYALGIAWTLFAYRASALFTGKFGDLFGQGFRCFIVVTLLMAVFYGVFNYANPSFREERANAYREYLKKDKNTLPGNIEKEVATFKKQDTLKLVSGAIFGYLIIGVGVTAATSAFLTRRK